MRINFISSGGWLLILAAELEKLGHRIVRDNPDIILGMSVSQMKSIWEAVDKYPKAKLINYNWDVYSWVWDNPRKDEYDYDSYLDLLKRSDQIWVPSEAERVRTEKWLPKSKSKIIKTFIPVWEYEDIKDERYILDPLREIPDKDWGIFEKACKELDIPYVRSEHRASFSEYKKLVAECSFIASPLRELSTGGLTLIEGYYLGKPCLLSDSPGHGGKDYMGDRAYYFKHDDYEDLKKQIKLLWDDTPKLNIKECRRWVNKNCNVKKMAEEIHHAISRY